MSKKLRYGKPEEMGMSLSRIEHARDFAKELVNQDPNYSTIVVFAARRGTIVLHEAFGKLGPEPDSPTTELGSIFPLSSLSKSVTATLVMLLVEDGLISLNHPVVDYVPEFIGEGKDKVMIHHLLTHTSGLVHPDVNEHAKKKKKTTEIPPAEETQDAPMNENLFLRHDAPLTKTPGEIMYYGGYNYDLLGEIIRRVSGQSLDDFAGERLFKPLGMKNSYYVPPDSVRHRIVRRPENVPFAKGLEFHANVLSGADGVISSAMDMGILGQMLLNGGVYGETRILSPASVYQMTRNQIPGIPWRYGDEIGPEGSYGFGWMIQGNDKFIDASVLFSPKSFYHGGTGFVYLWIDPVYELVGAFFSVAYKDKRNYREACLFANIVTAAVMEV